MIVPSERQERPPVPVALAKVLLVEGETPLHFFEALAKHLGIETQIEIRSFGGIKQLGAFLKTLASTAAFQEKVTSLGIARDCENNPVAAQNSMDAAIQAANIDAQKVTVSTALIPNTQNPGMIESLMMQSVQGSTVIPCIDAFFNCAVSTGLEIPQGMNRDKHIAQVYMAAHDHVQMPPGIAASRGLWPFNHAAFDDLKAFLNSL